MKKVINITLSSIVFAVEEDAHAMLVQYLDAISARLREVEDKVEVMADIESAIAEKFIASEKNEKRAVTTTDVKQVQREMGTPDAFDTDTESETRPAMAAIPPAKKRLFRNSDDAVFAGVASGLAQYFDVDPVIVRILFVLGVFLNGIGIIAYIILWIAVPKAETTTDKFAMRGKSVTVEDITNNAKQNLAASPLPSSEKAPTTWFGTKNIFEKLFHVFGEIARFCLSALRVFTGVLSIVIGLFGLVGLTSAYSIGLLLEKTNIHGDVRMVVDLISASSLGLVLLTAAVVLASIPLLLLIILGVSLLKKHNVLRAKVAVMLAVTWVVALTLATITGAVIGEKVLQEIGTHIDVADYVSEDLEVVVTENGADINYPGIPVPFFGTQLPKGLQGVTFSPQMIELDLTDRQLDGSLPAEIRFLSRLEVLDISYNDFTGLPAEIGQLSELRVLNLSHNDFTGLPHELGNLQKLELLDLRGNRVSQYDLDIITSQLPTAAVVLTD